MGEWIPSEREAVEAAFRDPNGLSAMVATPSLAQGMNFPAEAVIIAGDNRWEEANGDGHPSILPVHEILNAAGRAGRAGMFAQGIVFLVPGLKVFSIHMKNNTMYFNGLDHATALLGSPDQCLIVTDPLVQIMDHACSGAQRIEICSYFLQRFSHQEEEDTSESKRLLRSAFGYHEASITGQSQRIEALIDATLRLAVVAKPETPTPDNLIAELACSLGVSLGSLESVLQELPKEESIASITTSEWVSWILDYLMRHPQNVHEVLHLDASGLLRIIKHVPEKDTSEWRNRIALTLHAVVPAWIAGQTLEKLEPLLMKNSGRKKKLPMHPLARRFHNETAPSLGSLGYIIRRLVEVRTARSGSMLPPSSIFLKTLPTCLTRGYDTPAKLALDLVVARHRRTCRVDIHTAFTHLDNAALAIDPHMAFGKLVAKVEDAARLAGVI